MATYWENEATDNIMVVLELMKLASKTGKPYKEVEQELNFRLEELNQRNGKK